MSAIYLGERGRPARPFRRLAEKQSAGSSLSPVHCARRAMLRARRSRSPEAES